MARTARGTGGRVRGSVGAVNAAYLGHYQCTPTASSATAIVNAKALTASAQSTITTGITQPSAPRVLNVVGSAAGMAGNVIVKGNDAAGSEITETFALNGTTTVTGTKAFANVASVSYPVRTNGSGDTVSIGTTDKLGFPTAITLNTVEKAYYNNVLEGTPPTVTTGATVSACTFDPATVLAGAVVDVYYFVG